jgi:pantoate--beta-alanine ligase
MLEGQGADLLFNPTVETMYPRSQEKQTRVEVPGISELLCGASRPGHFVGVATVVCKLFNMVQPDVGVFGKKDFQQLMVIRRMVEDLAMPVRVVGIDTLREADGLAMSSRNGYLTADERALAPELYRVLCEIRERLVAGNDDYASLESEAADALQARGFGPDYVAIRRSQDLLAPEAGEPELVILAAAQLGKARLIDNIDFTR